MSRITVLVGSARKNGNTALLAQAFAEGARVHNDVEIISVADHQVNPCSGCNYCYNDEQHRCFQQDAMTGIYDRLRTTEVLVIASPIYFYGLSAQLKAIIDRLHTPQRSQFKIRQTALLLVGADTLPELFDAVIAQYRLTDSYFNLEDLGMVLARGVTEKGDIKDNPALKQAHALGLSII